LISRAKVVIDSKLLDAPSGSFGGYKGQKSRLHFFQQQMFCGNQDSIGVFVLFFFEKYQIHTSGEADY
jgi:hypothetical protein